MPVPLEHLVFVEWNRQDACSTRTFSFLWNGTGKMPVPLEHLVFCGTGILPVLQNATIDRLKQSCA
ncbi:hypothetical protein [Microcoleus sp. A003_D6]|uniref:hypothetical protein n=1 Tax=Microcoleus sp. A003_D6 TaxID=3055266 RepID=UPI002FD5E803